MSESGWLGVLVLLLGHLATFSVAVAQPSVASGRPQVASIKAGVVKIVTAPGSKNGTGIVVRRDAGDAWIVTAMHVVSDADKISVQFAGVGKSWTAEAKSIEFDNPAQGLALLRVAGELPAKVVALPLATDVALSGGEQAIIIGHQPSTGDWGVVMGTVSGRKGRELVIQAPIQEQSSGGPVIVNGRVVGLVQRRDPSGQFGYAVTAQAIKEYLDGNQVSVAAAPSTPPRSAQDRPTPIIPPTAKDREAQERILASSLASASAAALKALLDKGNKSNYHWLFFLSDEGGSDLLERSVLLAVESVRRVGSAEGKDALRRGLGFLVRPSRVLEHGYPVWAVVMSANGEHLATAGDDGTVRVWETASGREIVRVSISESVWGVALSPDGKLFATASRGDAGAAIWNALTSRQVHRLEHKNILDLAFSRDGSLLATASSKGKSAIVWDVNTGKEITRLIHDRPVGGVMFSDDAKHVFTRFDEAYRGPVFVWESRTGNLVQQLGQDEHPVQDFALSPDGTRLAAASGEKVRIYTVGQWDAVTTAASRPWKSAVAFSPDGAKLAVGVGASVEIMSPRTGELKHLGMGGDRTCFVAFSRDAKYVLSVHQDRTARVWEADGGRELMRVPTYEWAHRSRAPAAFSADGRFLIAIGYYSVNYWPLSPEEPLIDEACRRLTRNLTRAEWKEFLPDERYQKTCPSLP